MLLSALQDVLYDVKVPKRNKLKLLMREYFKFKTGIRITQHHCQRFWPSHLEPFEGLESFIDAL